jgi:hypothetical protein
MTHPEGRCDEHEILGTDFRQSLSSPQQRLAPDEPSPSRPRPIEFPVHEEVEVSIIHSSVQTSFSVHAGLSWLRFRWHQRDGTLP